MSLTLFDWGIKQTGIREKGFISEWTVSGDEAGRTITLPLYNSGIFDCTVYWGDGLSDTITAYNDADRIHTYDVAGTYKVEIVGECPAWSFNNAGDKLKITDIIYWGDSTQFGGFSYLTSGFYGCTNLKSLGEGLLLVKAGLTSLSYLFASCPIKKVDFEFFKYATAVTTFWGVFLRSSLESIPADLFRYNVAVTNFDNCFDNGYSSQGSMLVDEIPTDLFRYNVAVTQMISVFRGLRIKTVPVDIFRYNIENLSFYYTFSTCEQLESLPQDIFRYNTKVGTWTNAPGFGQLVSYTSKLETLPADIFRYQADLNSPTSGGLSDFTQCFYESGITEVDSDLFKYNTKMVFQGFQYVFYNAGELITIPTDLFRYNVSVSTGAFKRTFMGCSKLETAPASLFKYNTAVSTGGFDSTFQACNKLQLNQYLFYASGEESTRFKNRTSDFSDCFNRSSFTGTQGTAPELWNCDFGSVTPTKTDCFAGNGNSTTSLTNYNSIPSAWGGPA